MAAQAILIAGQIAGSLLSAHTARLTAATNENAALDQLIPAFDEDLKAIADAFNSGTPASECIAALQAVDTNAYNYLRAQVGKSGTSWNGPSSAQLGATINPSYSITCNSGCTAGCCVYLNDLRPAIFGRSGLGTSYAPWQTAPGLVSGLIGVIQKGGGTVKVIDVAPPSNKAYGNYQRTGYALTLKAPPPSQTIAAKVLTSTGSGSSFAIQEAPPTPTSEIAAVPTAAGAVLGSLTSNSTVAILTVVGGVILILTALFGQDALRVK